MNTIQERMRQKAFTALDIVEFEIDKLMDKKTSSFSMLKYLKHNQESCHERNGRRRLSPCSYVADPINVLT